MKLCRRYFLAALITLLLFSCRQEALWEGQEAIQRVNTATVPIQQQWKGTFDLGTGIKASNDFEGARLNGIVQTNDSLVTALITPENTPVNDSPWYAFKLWSGTVRKINLQLTYQDGVRHRYYPKISHNGIDWSLLDSSDYTAFIVPDSLNSRQQPDRINMKLSVGPDTLWIAAQELVTSTHVNQWMSQLGDLPFCSIMNLGESREGRPVSMMKIGTADDRDLILVISRQHPPEVTGYLAMQAFIERFCSKESLATKFRERYNIYIVPLMNPDGVARGHWRHSSAGIDLNRDWMDFNQPETALVRDFMLDKKKNGSIFLFAVDFHSTYEDIYYTMDPKYQGNMPGLVPDFIRAVAEDIEGYRPNISPRPVGEPPVSSMAYFFHTFGAESLTYEIGDNTDRSILKEKGGLAAQKLMELMMR